MTEHTPGPWVQFADQGKCIAIMPAGRTGDICTFQQSPSDDDARLMTAAPGLVKALQDLDAVLDFGDENPGSVWTFDETDAVQAAMKQARDVLASVGRLPDPSNGDKNA